LWTPRIVLVSFFYGRHPRTREQPDRSEAGARPHRGREGTSTLALSLALGASGQNVMTTHPSGKRTHGSLN
jgi:hypothetical protein